ncbi:MAG: hydroxymethylglutaryl-CoA reductase, degradative [Flavobacteriia bacterium]|nr:hydroxymethylglutaryl-CoA reductase, degradative [Flavobacteriia bacterium]
MAGFSKLSKDAKIDWVSKTFTRDKPEIKALLTQYWHADESLQQLHDEFIENTLSNFYLPLGVAPNFLINERLYTIPMAIEESSVVAAASKAAKFWLDRGGFKTEVLGTEKIGQVHFFYEGDPNKLSAFFDYLKPILIKDCSALTANMEKRGGGISSIELRDKSSELKHYYQIHAVFETANAMGANFINSCLEQFAKSLQREAAQTELLDGISIEVVMSILSNYVPQCLVKAMVSCPVSELEGIEGASGADFAKKMVQAVQIAKVEPHRAVTHNKGIMNGIDAVVIATGNDFRAVEAGVHAYAAKEGSYSSLTHASVEDGIFKFWIEVPLALGTVGGLTNLHPLVKWSFEVLQKPSAKELMGLVAVAGLAQNFAALHSLVTSGIQKGHMKMHLMNILNQLGATESEKQLLIANFKNETATHSNVVQAFERIRAATQNK